MHSSQALQEQFNNYLQNQLEQNEPYVLEEPVRYFLSLGGKRLRPVLLLMAADLFQADIDKSMPVAMALEFFHNFTLIHDDMMDEASVRRGYSTTHEHFGENTALLTGDLLLVFAYQYLQKASISKKDEAWQLFNKTASQVCEGQQYDLLYEQSAEVSVNDYLHMIELKTAVLLGTCMKLGAIIGNANEENKQNIYEFGKYLGISFQLQDDLLDTFGDEESLGKRVGGDILQDKKTFLLLRSFEKANAEQVAELNSWMGTKKEPEYKIGVIKGVFETLDVKDEAEQLRNKYYERAHSHLDAVNQPRSQKQPLIDFANQLLFRSK